MTTEIDPVVALNRIVRMLLGSFPVYLETTRPWSVHDPKNVCGRLGVIAADQRAMADRFIQKIHLLGAQVEPIGFPREFTAFNDLAIAKVVEIAIQRQNILIHRLEKAAETLGEYSGLSTLTKEAVGNARGHLTAMEELRAGL